MIDYGKLAGGTAGTRNPAAPCCAVVICALILAALLFVGIPWGLAQEASIKVLVNDVPISEYDIDQRERFLAITTQQQPSPALKKQAADMLIDEALQVQQARKLSVTINEDDVTTILKGMAEKNNLDVEGLSTALARAGVNVKTLKDRIRAQIYWQEAVRRKFRRDVQIGDAEVTAAMSENEADGATGGARETTLQLRQVKFEVPSGADQATLAARLAAAESVRGRFTSCADLAKGVTGASVKTLQDQNPASLAQPARLLVMNAKVGQMTPPMIAAAAIELYAVCGKRSSSADEEARAETQRKLMNQEMGLRAQRLLRDLRQEAFIEYR